MDRGKGKVSSKNKIIFIITAVVFFLSYFIFCRWRYDDRNYTVVLENSKLEYGDSINEIKIGTYNIKSLNNGTSKEKFIQDIEEVELDIIALQEVDQNASRSNRMDMTKELAEEAGYDYCYFYKSVWLFDGAYGISILSKYPILEVSSLELPNGSLSEPRILAKAIIDVNGNKINVYNTHLNFFNREIHKNQISTIESEIGNSNNSIFLGDMNSFRVSDFFDINGFTALNTKENSYLTFGNNGFTDNIYLSNDLKVLNVNVKETSFSDHHLFWCTFKFTESSDKK